MARCPGPVPRLGIPSSRTESKRPESATGSEAFNIQHWKRTLIASQYTHISEPQKFQLRIQSPSVRVVLSGTQLEGHRGMTRRVLMGLIYNNRKVG